MGEVFVFVFFGLVATVGTFYVESLHLDEPVVWFAAVAVGLLATGLLLANNLRDIATDRASGKRTLAVRVGRRAGAGSTEPASPFPSWGCWCGRCCRSPGPCTATGPPWPSCRWLALPLTVAPVRLALGRAEGRALLPVLAATGRLQLVFGVLLSVSLWLCLPLALPWGLP